MQPYKIKDNGADKRNGIDVVYKRYMNQSHYDLDAPLDLILLVHGRKEITIRLRQTQFIQQEFHGF